MPDENSRSLGVMAPRRADWIRLLPPRLPAVTLAAPVDGRNNQDHFALRKVAGPKQ